MTTTGTANMNDLGYEEAEDWEEEGEYDDGDDDEYDDDDDDDRMQALPDNMNTGSISIMAGRNNSDPGQPVRLFRDHPQRADARHVLLLEFRPQLRAQGPPGQEHHQERGLPGTPARHGRRQPAQKAVHGLGKLGQ